MKAVVYTSYGPPEVLQLKEVPKPIPADNEILIKIHAATVNRTDCGFRKPEYPVIIRLVNGLFKPKRTILGNELAGEVEAIGMDVKAFKKGDKVFGLSTDKFATHAEYICLPETGSIAHMPVNMPYEEAAAVCDGLMLANNLVGKIDFSKVRRILVNGATGSIGSACVQLSKYYGAHVTAVCNTRNIGLMKSLGADDVIDYSVNDFTASGQQYDVVLDAVGKSSFFKSRKILGPHGIYASTELGFMMQNIFLSLLTPLFGGKKVMFPIPKATKEGIIIF